MSSDTRDGDESGVFEIDDEDMQEFERKMRDASLRMAVATIAHPLHMTKTLVQLGHEPMPLSLGKQYVFFGRTVYMLPNFFNYARHIYSEHGGLAAIYTGAGASLVANLTAAAASIATTIRLDKRHPDFGGPPITEDDGSEMIELKLDDSQSIKLMYRRAMRDSVARVVAVVVARPMNVVMIRQIAEMATGGSHYPNWFSSLRIIYNEEGLKGLFSGLVPQLIAELSLLWGQHVLICMATRAYINYCAKTDNEGKPLTDKDSCETMTNYSKITKLVVPMVCTGIVYPFNLVATCMAVNGVDGLQLGNTPHTPIFDTWKQCYNYLTKSGCAKRGASMILRAHQGAISAGSDGNMYAVNKRAAY